LYVATADRVAFAGLGELDPARINEASVRHWALCARVAVILEQRALRGLGRAAVARRRTTGRPARRQRPAWHLARRAAAAAPARSRAVSDTAPPVAVEVELSMEAAGHLEAICRAWARCRIVSEVRYYAPAHVQRAVSSVLPTTRSESCPWTTP
jgi:hypothetical protein